MSKKIKTQSVAINNGGTATVQSNGKGGFTMTVTRGYKETPEERRERIANGPRANRIPSGKRKQSRGGRNGGKRAAIRDSRNGW